MTTAGEPSLSRQVRRAMEREATKVPAPARRMAVALSRAGTRKMPRPDPEPHKPGKGLFDGNCNREACQVSIEGWNWFNTSTRKYYCGRCADLINVDALRFDGVTILVPVEDPDDQPEFPYERMRAHREARARAKADPA